MICYYCAKWFVAVIKVFTEYQWGRLSLSCSQILFVQVVCCRKCNNLLVIVVHH